MKKATLLFGAALAAAVLARAGRAEESADGPGHSMRDPLVEKLAGEWKITRKIRGKEVENRAKAEWVLNHQFLELRMTDVAKPPAYEAIVLIGYRRADARYVVYWCDTWGGTFSASGTGTRKGDAIEIEFSFPDGPFFNTFSWDEKTGTWTSRMESIGQDGQRTLFAEDTYRRP